METFLTVKRVTTRGGDDVEQRTLALLGTNKKAGAFAYGRPIFPARPSFNAEEALCRRRQIQCWQQIRRGRTLRDNPRIEVALCSDRWAGMIRQLLACSRARCLGVRHRGTAYPMETTILDAGAAGYSLEPAPKPAVIPVPRPDEVVGVLDAS